jgi:hypothetical protein
MLLDFLDLKLSRTERFFVVRHLLRQCPICLPLQRAVFSNHPVFREFDPVEDKAA